MISGLAVSALAAVEQPKTVASAKTAEFANPNSLQEQSARSNLQPNGSL
jgi:hypothetical protein